MSLVAESVATDLRLVLPSCLVLLNTRRGGLGLSLIRCGSLYPFFYICGLQRDRSRGSSPILCLICESFVNNIFTYLTLY